jgi:hypothetical protein
MLRIQAALREFTGSLEILVFQTLLAGNIGQFAAPGTRVLARAAWAAAFLAAVLWAAVLWAAAFFAAALSAAAFLAASELTAAGLAAAVPAAVKREAGLRTADAAGLTCTAQAVTVPQARSMASGTTVRRRERRRPGRLCTVHILPRSSGGIRRKQAARSRDDASRNDRDNPVDMAPNGLGAVEVHIERVRPWLCWYSSLPRSVPRFLSGGGAVG